MRRWLALTGIVLGILAAVWVQIGIINIIPLAGYSLQLVVLMVLVVALFNSWTMASWLALLAGALLGQFSLWPLAYPCALLGMVAGTWLVLQRWLATRSPASLIAAAVVATILFHVILGVTAAMLHSFAQTTVGPDWGLTFRTMLLQCIFHPLIMYIIWLRWTGGSYARTIGKQSF